MSIRAILFDKDGTLIDFAATWPPIYRELAEDLAGGDARLAEAMLIRGGLDRATGRFRAGSALAAGTTAEIADLWFPHLEAEPRRGLIARIDRAFLEGGLRHSVALVDLPSLFGALKRRGLRLGVATNDMTEAAARALARLDAASALDFVIGYDRVRNPKPAGDMVHAFCASCGIAPAEVAVVGDSVHDLAMARAAGAGVAIGVLSGTTERARLAPLADFILDSVADLPAWLDRR
jgi:phosphoglycolate phosphatase